MIQLCLQFKQGQLHDCAVSVGERESREPLPQLLKNQSVGISGAHHR